MTHGPGEKHRPKPSGKPPAPKGNMKIVGQNVTLRDNLPRKGGRKR